MATFEITHAPLGTVYSPAIGAGEADDKNDFDVFIVANEPVTGLTLAGISVSSTAGTASIEGQLRGEHNVYGVKVRPPEDEEGTITLTIAADAVNEGNPETTQDINFFNGSPTSNAQTPTTEFTSSFSGSQLGIATSLNRLYVLGFDGGVYVIKSYTYDGTEQTAEEITLPTQNYDSYLHYLNDKLLVQFPDHRNTAFVVGYNTDGSRAFSTELDNIPDVLANITTTSFQPGGLYTLRPVAYSQDRFYANRRLRRQLSSVALNESGDVVDAKFFNVSFSATDEPSDIAIFGDTIYTLNHTGAFV